VLFTAENLALLLVLWQQAQKEKEKTYEIERTTRSTTGGIEACLSKALEALRKSSQATQTCREGHGEQKVSISFQQARKELKGTKEESA
jgi:hypothetical protein